MIALIPFCAGGERFVAVIAALLVAAAVPACDAGAPGPDEPAVGVGRQAAIIGISTSLPIVWPETDDIAEMLNGDRAEHWALEVLRGRGQVRPLDTVAGPDGALPLPADAMLVLAQPFPFSPDEYVALDDWVRDGGRALLFADPMLTFDSVFAIGDRRRPQDIVKLDPVLLRWGLRLERDEGARPGEHAVEAMGGQIPVNLPGRFTAQSGSGCAVEAGGLVAECAIGKGRVLAVADAALLESESNGDSRRDALLRLLDRLGNAD